MGGCACTASSARAGQACDECADVVQSPAERPTPASWRDRAWEDENQKPRTRAWYRRRVRAACTKCLLEGTGSREVKRCKSEMAGEDVTNFCP